MTENKEMVLFATEDQFSLKYGELLISECYWTIPMYPKDKDNFVGKKLYFYLRSENTIMTSATITGFDVQDGKKIVLFEFKDDDYEFEPISMKRLGHEKN